MVRDVLQIGAQILSQPTIDITRFDDPEVQQVVKDLLDTCRAKREVTAGLAAPQIGSTFSIIVCRRIDHEEKTDKEVNKAKLWEVMINPKIVKESTSTSVLWEACLSVGGDRPDGLWAPVTRPEKIEVKYFNPQGKQLSIKADDYLSHIIQHEIDHLKGIIFLAYVNDPTIIWKAKDLDDYYEKHGEYPPV